MNLRISAITALAVSLFSVSAFAQMTTPPPVPKPVETKTISVTLSPIHLLFPVVELTGEYAVMPKLGVAGILGAGVITVEDGFDSYDFTVIEVGAQGNYYLVGDFDHGMQLGAEALLVAISGDNLGDVDVSGTGQGFAIGPYIGYKIAASFGLTFFAQLGGQYNISFAQATDGTRTESGSASGFGVLLNLNLGWSF